MERELIMDTLLDQVVGGVDCFITKFKKEDSSEWFEARYPDGGYIQCKDYVLHVGEQE